MINDYIKHKIKLKVTTHLRLAGLDVNVDISPLIEKVKLMGYYKIIWKKDIPIDIVMIDFENKVEVNSGKYFIFNESGHFIEQLYSSEFIEFNLKEMREFKLSEILK